MLKYITSLEAAKVKTIALKVATNALGAAIEVGLIFAISKIAELVGELIVTKEELADIRQEALDSSEDLKNSVESFVEEAEAVNEIVKQYKEIVITTDDLSSSKDDLLKIQGDLIDKFGEEAKGLDLVNGKYDEQIQKIDELSQKQYDEWKRREADKIKRAETLAGYNVLYGGDSSDSLFGGIFRRNTQSDNDIKELSEYSNFLERGKDSLADSLYILDDISEEIININENIEGLHFEDTLVSNRIFLSGTIEDAKSQIAQLIDLAKEQGASEKDLAPLVKRYNELIEALENIDYYQSKIREYEAVDVDVVGEVSTAAIESLREYYSAADQVRSEWFESLDEMQNGFGKTVDSMTSALQALANGEELSGTDFWGLMKLDTNKVLTDIKMVGDKFVLNEEQLIDLKDQYIQSQVESLEMENETLKTKQKELSTTLDQAQAELSVLGARGLANATYREEYNAAAASIRNGKENLAEYGEQIRRNNLFIEQWKSKLGNTVDLTEALAAKQKKLNDEISALNKQADNLLKAQEYKIDSIISGHQSELDVLNEQKEALQDELNALNEQKDTLEDIISNYETVNSLVQNTVQKEIDALEEQKKAIEDTYNKRIEALKSENEEREDALEYAQKLANLENAKNNKRRVYDEARGWRYEAVKEDVVKAQNDLAAFENSQAIKQLEEERDKETAVIDDLIKNKEDYAELWKEINEEIQSEEDERLAQEILGADWREKIAAGDMAIMDKFRTEYRNHNTALQTLTNSEIKLKEAAIKAKDAEIDSKKKQIEVWQKYKTEVQNAAKAIKEANEDYMKQVDDINLKENSSLQDRENNLRRFESTYSNIMDNVVNLQNQLSSQDYSIGFSVDGLGELREARDVLQDIAISTMAAISSQDMIKKLLRGEWSIADAVTAMKEGKIQGYSSGGVADYTGVAMLHGRKNAPETIFNANDSAKLYDLVHNTPNLVASAIAEANKLAGFKLSNNSNTNNSATNTSIYIDKIVTDNPQDFAKQLDRYYRTKLTETYTSKQ